MEKIAYICREVSDTQHVLTYKERKRSLLKGAITGARFGHPIEGAVANLSLEASKKVLLISRDIVKESRYKSRKTGM